MPKISYKAKILSRSIKDFDYNKEENKCVCGGYTNDCGELDHRKDCPVALRRLK